MPDLSGRWQLVEPTAAEHALDTLVIAPADQLIITHTRFGITVVHPSKPGAHPRAGSFEYGHGGIVGDGIPNDTSWSVTHIGTQLMISRSTKGPLDSRGARVVSARGSMWRLDGPNRLVIEFGEERTGERPKIATRVYVRRRGAAAAPAPIAPRTAPRAAAP